MSEAFEAFNDHGNPEPYAQIFTPEVLVTSSQGPGLRQGRAASLL